MYNMIYNRVVVEKSGEEMARLPILFVIIATIVAPWLTIFSAIVALLTGCTVRVERSAKAYAYSRSQNHPYNGGSDDRH